MLKAPSCHSNGFDNSYSADVNQARDDETPTVQAEGGVCFGSCKLAGCTNWAL